MRKFFSLFVTIALLAAPVLQCEAQSSDLSSVLERDDLSSFVALQQSGDLINEKVLLESIKAGAVKVCSYILEKGVSTNVHFEDGQTPLIKAINEKSRKIIEVLIDQGADLNLPENEGLRGTPLMYAGAWNDAGISKLLLEAGADVNAVDVNKDPALNWATYYGHVQVMKLLISEGADLNVRSKHGQAVDVGLRLWHADSVMEVFRNTSIALPQAKREREFFQFVQSNDLKNTTKILTKYNLANSKDVLGTPLLQLAVQQGWTQMVDLLLSKGANPNEINRVGQTPLAFAARFEYREVVDLLIRAGADPNMAGSEYYLTPLMGAAIGGNVDIGVKLIEAGAKLELKDVVNQCAALHWSLLYGHENFAIMLLEKGADFHTKVLEGGHTAKSLAKALKLKSVSGWIDKHELENNPLKGSWRIDQLHYLRTDTTIKVKVSQGRFIFSDRHYHLIYNPWIEKRRPFVSLSYPTTEEMVHAFQTLVFNSGEYTFADSTITALPDIARVPGFEGGRQYYTYRAVGDEMTLTMYDETYPDGTKPDWYGKLKILFILKKE